MRRLITAITAITTAACIIGCQKDDPVILGGNSGDNGNNANNANGGDCRIDDDCGQLMFCEDRECVPCRGEECRTSTNNGVTVNNAQSNNSTSQTANNTTGTNNGTSGPAACDDPGGTERFALWDNGIEVPIDYDGDNRATGIVITSGVAILDSDGDGDNDVIVTNQGGELKFFENDGSGRFTDETASVGLDGLTKTTSLTTGDIDGDGDIDVVVGRTEGIFLLQNEGGTFIDATAAWGLENPTDVVSGAAFADFDGDGDLDLYVANYLPRIDDPGVLPMPMPNRLYRNAGASLTEVTSSPGGVGEEGATLAVAWWDFDEDGRPDIWSANDFGMLHAPNQLFRNLGPDPEDPDNWLFEDIAGEAGLDAKIFSMSASLADFDNDGDQDGYAANMANNVLHVKSGDTTSDEAVSRGVAAGHLPDPRPRPLDPPVFETFIDGMAEFFDDYADVDSGLYTLTSWSSVFFDANHDGWQDLFVANGVVINEFTPEASFQPNYLFLSNRDGTFDRSPCWYIPDIRGSSRGAAVGDLDGDGDLDLIWVETGLNGDPGVYTLRNDDAAGNWLIVKLRGAGANTEGIGAKVTLVTDQGPQTRWIDGGQTFLSVSERVAHFGLGDSESVTQLIVEWPGGTIQEVPVDAVNRRIVVTEP